MIKFFRTIRYKLMSQNKTSQYLKYAVGEIILVVIGILIALSINNWNEDRKQEYLKQRLYVELRGSIMSDTVSLNSNLDDLRSAFENSKLLKRKISEDAPYTSELDSSFAKIGLIRSTEADYVILSRLSDVGIEIIDDVKLKNEVIHYYEDSQNFLRYAENPQDLLKMIYPKYFTEHILDEIAVPENFEELKRANEFKIALDYCLQASEELLKRTEHRKDMAINILKMLDNEINISKDQLPDSPYVRLIARDTLNGDLD